MKIKYTLVGLILFQTSLFSMPALSGPEWYVSKVVEVSTQASTGALYIRTESAPNPANCGGGFAGANWKDNNNDSKSLAASIALSAKAIDSEVRFQIDDSNCGEGAMPLMLWIQQQ